jgi:acylpyruvate hydrolase
MKLVSFGSPGEERPGVVVDDRVVDLLSVRPEWPRSWRGILRAGLLPASGPRREIEEAVREGLGRRRRMGFYGAAAEDGQRADAMPSRDEHAGPLLAGTRLGPPVADPSKIVAIGLNYRDHALEQKKEPPAAPLLFAKAPSSLVGPRDAIRLPDPAIEERVDAEAELCVVLGARARNVQESDALEHVLGWTILNDVSGRGAQYGDKQWFRGKSFDTFAPCGPWIVTRDELPDPSGLSLSADWSGRPMQRGNTRDLIFAVPALIAYVSRMMTLEPGDLIATGTPAGVGVFRDPPVFLARGDVVTIRLEGVGELINPVE